MTMNETIDGQTGEVMTPAPVAQMTIPASTALPVLVETLGEDGIHERVQRALDTPGAIQDLHGKPYIGFIGSAVIASKLGVSVSTGNIQSRIAADGVMEYICEARVLGPHGSIVAVECIMSLADAKGSGMRLDRGQLVNKLSTRPSTAPSRLRGAATSSWAGTGSPRAWSTPSTTRGPRMTTRACRSRRVCTATSSMPPPSRIPRRRSRRRATRSR